MTRPAGASGSEAEQVQSGKALYAQHCSHCHGFGMVNAGNVVPDLNSAATIMTALFMLLAQEIHRAMGITAQNVVLRVSGILLAAVAMQFLFDGLAASGILAGSR